MKILAITLVLILSGCFQQHNTKDKTITLPSRSDGVDQWFKTNSK